MKTTNLNNQESPVRLSVWIPREEIVKLVNYELLFEDLTEEERARLLDVCELDVTDIVRTSYPSPLTTTIKKKVRQGIDIIKSNRQKKELC